MDRETRRLDLWLWQARFFKSRSLAAKLLRTGKLRMDGVAIVKPSRAVHVGAVLTFPQGGRIRVIEVAQLATRRGPASEATALYRDLTPPQARLRTEAPAGMRKKGEGRPTKKDRRAISRLKDF
ncbi:MAG TPA: RNA-binding S4 domain-containing protein [Sphingomonadales bacterium]|nr:RNA-binding S4 domain-containing protein [Sphingomonadales bacterium]